MIRFHEEFQRFLPDDWTGTPLMLSEGHYEPLEPLSEGPLGPDLAPEVEAPRDLYEDDKYSYLKDEWRAEEREWLEDFREQCREYR